jgi:hypothetical protein
MTDLEKDKRIPFENPDAKSGITRVMRLVVSVADSEY